MATLQPTQFPDYEADRESVENLLTDRHEYLESDGFVNELGHLGTRDIVAS